MNKCGCGCGADVQKRFQHGHHARLPEQKERRASAMRRPEVRAKCSASAKLRPPTFTGRTHTAETRAKLSVAAKRQWVEKREEMLLAFKKRGPVGKKDTSIELAVRAELDRRQVPYEAHAKICGWNVDVYIPSLRLVVECDGDYWHSLPNVIRHDARKNSDWLKAGYGYARLSETAIKKIGVTHLGELDLIQRKYEEITA